MENTTDFGNPQPLPAAAPEAKAVVKPKATRAKRAPQPAAAAAEAPQAAVKLKSKFVDAEDERMHEMKTIRIYDNADIPPSGQFVSVNGKAFLIQPGRDVTVPRYVLHALDNAVRKEPIIDQNKTVIGYRDVSRFPYTLVE